jgi:hypothetical protein
MKKKNFIILCVGPMTINTIKSVNLFTKEKKQTINLICSRNQVEANKLGSGYVSNFSTEKFSKYIKKLNNKYIKLARDHGGPFTSDKRLKNTDLELTRCKKSFEADIKSGFKTLHIDTSFLGNKKFEYAVNLYKFCQKKSKKLKNKIEYEIGVNFHGDKFKKEEFNKIITQFGDLKNVKFITGTTGSETAENKQIGKFNFQNSKFMVSELHKKGKLLKDHNCDFLNSTTIKLRKKSGIQCFNIGPEVAYVENKLLFDFGKKSKNPNFNLFFKIVISNNKWKKWCKNKSSNKIKFLSSAHYFYYNKNYLRFKREFLDKNNFDDLVIKEQRKIYKKFY